MTITQFGEYQQFIHKTGEYPGQRKIGEPPNLTGISYTALGLTGEAGEVADKVKKILRDHDGQLTDELRQGLIKEMGDTLWYLTALAVELDVSMAYVAQTNMDKINDRTARGTRQGSGDDR